MASGKIEKMTDPAMGSNRVRAIRVFTRAPDTKNAANPTPNAIVKVAILIPIEFFGSWPRNVFDLKAALNKKYQYVIALEWDRSSKLRNACL